MVSQRPLKSKLLHITPKERGVQYVYILISYNPAYISNTDLKLSIPKGKNCCNGGVNSTPLRITMEFKLKPCRYVYNF